MRLDLASYRELEAFTQFGSDLDQMTKMKLERGKRTIEVLKQGLHEPVEVIDQIIILYALTKGYLDDVAINEIQAFERELRKYTKETELGKNIINIINETHDLPQNGEISTLIENFKKER